ncbi:MAG: response regulator [Pseudomonadota bacterium]
MANDRDALSLEANASASPARVLIVDDNSVMRMKMRKAVNALGHDTEVAKDGIAALEILQEQEFDAVLLDIVMPGLDGYGVLEKLKANDATKHLPVIVISALDDEVESVVRAIELGAEDFLPKDFDPVLLRARLNASLAKKRFRDQELEYFARIDRLTAAAEVLESGRFNPDTLALDDLTTKDDPLGRLAIVFRGMASEIYYRELKLRQTISTLRGSLWVIAIGIVWGLTPSLSRIVMSEGATPLGLMVWVNPVIAAIFVGLAWQRGVLPKLTLPNIAFFIAWALVAAVFLRLALLYSSEHVEAAILSLVLTLQGFLVFGFSAIAGMDKATLRRLVGLVVGLGGVGLVLWTEMGQSGATNSFWLIFALLIPLLLAIEVMMMAGFRPTGLDDVGAVAMMLVAANLIGVPWALWQDQTFPISLTDPGRLELTLLLMIAVTTASYLMGFHLIKTAGAVFYSQTAYTMTIAGVIWGFLLLDEQLSPLAWIAFAIIAVGMYMVEPKNDGTDIVIDRKFDRS